MSKIFTFDAASCAPRYEQQGWIHIPGGASDAFREYVRSFIAEAAEQRLSGKGFAGAKDQLLLELPPAYDLEQDLLEPIAVLAGLDPERIVLSERHIKMYSADADPRPRAHKDRFASQVSVGISIDVPEGSHVVLYPNEDTGVNPLLRPGLVDALPLDRQPEHTLHTSSEVAIHDAPGDVLAFPGAAVWHLRRNSASTALVYLKCNDFGCDPLCEDPRTPGVRERTEALLGDEVDFLVSRPQLSRRFESVTREFDRNLEREWFNVHVWDKSSRMISELEFDVLRAVDGRSSVQSVAHLLSDRDGEVVRAVRRLTELGALDLASA